MQQMEAALATPGLEGDDGPTDVAQLLQCDPQAKMGIGEARLSGDGLPQCRDGVRYEADFEAGEAEIVLDDGVGWLQQRCFAQRRDRIGRPPGAEQFDGQRKQGRHRLRLG